LGKAVADKIIELISNETLKPGDKTPTEKELIEGLGVSRTAVREGIKRLETLVLLKYFLGMGLLSKRIKEL
jgi:DNA-binding FadR family transcriptional regulator